jgi:hypothetical protein
VPQVSVYVLLYSKSSKMSSKTWRRNLSASLAQFNCRLVVEERDARFSTSRPSPEKKNEKNINVRYTYHVKIVDERVE